MQGKFFVFPPAHWHASLVLRRLMSVLQPLDDNCIEICVYLFRHLTESYEFKINREFNEIMIDIAAINAPIPFSLTFTA